MTKTSVLPAQVEQSLFALGRRLKKGESVRCEVPGVIAALSTLPALTISRAARAINVSAELHSWRPEPPLFEALVRRRLSDKEQLLQLPELAYLFLFHSDGRIREAALQRINGGLITAFWFAAVAFRLNDWADPVRAAALACARRCFPLTAPEVIAAAAEALLLRKDSWRRWSREKEAVDAVFGRPDVARCLASMICHARTGPASRMLRTLLKGGAMDSFLPTLAREALQPAVRAVAVHVLTSGKVTWIAGTEWKWVDKSMGQRLRVPICETRELAPSVDGTGVIEPAACDRSVIVRRAALAALIEHHLNSRQAVETATRLQADSNASVREKAQFILARQEQG